MFRASCCDIPFRMMPWNVSHMCKCNLALLFCFSCFVVVDQREVSGSKHLWFNVPDIGILSFCFFLSVPILFQSVVASRDSEFEARISREWPACCGLGGESAGMVARIFCCPEYRAMIMVWLCRNLLYYFFNHSNKVEQLIIDSLFSGSTVTQGEFNQMYIFLNGNKNNLSSPSSGQVCMCAWAMNTVNLLAVPLWIWRPLQPWYGAWRKIEKQCSLKKFF